MAKIAENCKIFVKNRQIFDKNRQKCLKNSKFFVINGKKLLNFVFFTIVLCTLKSLVNPHFNRGKNPLF